ncbi:MAG: hypothetical protein ABSF61_06540 [Anaerolineales bacterium]
MTVLAHAVIASEEPGAAYRVSLSTLERVFRKQQGREVMLLLEHQPGFQVGRLAAWWPNETWRRIEGLLVITDKAAAAKVLRRELMGVSTNVEVTSSDGDPGPNLRPWERPRAFDGWLREVSLVDVPARSDCFVLAVQEIP